MPSLTQVAPRRLTARLIVAIVAVILATTVAAGLPAYWLIRTELEEQAWARLADGRQTTMALLSAEQARLDDAATLTSQRPTLQKLLREKDVQGLSEYLTTYQASTDLDLIIVSETAGQPLVNIGSPSSGFNVPLSKKAAFYLATGVEPQLILLASQPVLGNEADELLGYVSVGIRLDKTFAQQLAGATGFDQSIIFQDRRIATSLADPTLPIDTAAVGKTIATDQSQTAALPAAAYYTTLLPIYDARGQVVALMEVALGVNRLMTTERQALLILLVSTVLVALVGSLLGGLYTRQLTAPLDQLTAAALKISQGELATPVPIPTEPLEIAVLAEAFEASRVNTHLALNDLSQAKIWLETLIQSIVEGIVTFDEKGAITSFSQGAERITGWPSDEVLGQPLNDVFRMPEGDGKFMEYIPPAGGQRQIGILSRQGRPTTLMVTGAQLTSPDGSTTQTALVLRDTTEEEATQQLRSYFLANISHEFRTPLAALRASVELLLEELEDLSRSEIGELLNSIHLSLTGLETLIDNLLESTSIEAGRFRIRCHPTEFATIVTEATRMVKPLLDRRQQKLVLNQTAQLPPVNIDPTRMTQVLVNLLSNASKYSPVKGTIELKTERTEDHCLRVTVADHGPGISPIEQEHLFRRFVRLGATDNGQYGVGLGLSVVKTIIEEHGGQVGVTPRPGGGSIFWVSIPISGDKS
jgi:PAS domain S-box-containing protein